MLAVAGTATPFVFGGLSSFVTEGIPNERRAYAIDALAYNLGAVAGPAAVAAAHRPRIGALATLVMAAAALLGTVGTIPLGLRPAASAPHASMLGTIAAGFRHIATHRPLAVITASGTVSQFGAGGLTIAAVALAVARGGDAAEGAIIVTAFAIGGLLGALWNSAHPSRLRPEIEMGLGFAATGRVHGGRGGRSRPGVGGRRDRGVGPVHRAERLRRCCSSASSRVRRPCVRRSSPSGRGCARPRSAAGAAVAGLAAGIGGQALIVAIGVVWILSGAMLLAYPKNAPPIDGT